MAKEQHFLSVKHIKIFMSGKCLESENFFIYTYFYILAIFLYIIMIKTLLERFRIFSTFPKMSDKNLHEQNP